KLLEGTVGFEHSVEMPDEEHVRALAGPFRDYLTRTFPFLSIAPASLEPECIKLLAKQSPDFADAFEIHRAAVDVHSALEQRQRFVIVRLHESDKRTLRFGKIFGLCGSRRCIALRGRPAPQQQNKSQRVKDRSRHKACVHW